ncbi:MAG: enoyl-CoA hydratase/isomerase family protein [Methanomassiliicoccales archaeon]|nr:MAG: enoyl-CoA hydratase/isomerase family protein [Methanomassiliicoccales archaeon]
MGSFEPKPAEEFDFKDIIYEKKDYVAKVTINRPQVYNAYSILALREMAEAFKDASWDDSVAVLVLTGAGDKAFCTGGDVKEYADNYTVKPRDFWKWMGDYTLAHDMLRNCGIPTIARVNGIVAGGGNEFHMSCDLSIAAEHAEILQVGTKVGSVAAGGATQFLPIMVGDRRAREILYLCEKIPAKKALEWGLVNEVVPYEELDAAVDRMCKKLIDKFPECMRYTKQQVNFWKDLAWHSTIGHARDWLSIHFASYEPWEGMKSFVEKRETGYRKLRDLAAQGKSSEFVWGPYTKECGKCGAKGIPEEFGYCGKCGEKL